MRAGPLLVAGFLALAATGRAGASDFVTDEQGRTFRVRFDPGSELRLGMLGGAHVAGETRFGDPVLATGLGYRAQPSGGMKHEQVRWQLDHRVLWGRVRPWAGTVGGVPQLDATLYSGVYLRHTDEPFLMLPSNPPRRMFFPFDVGVEAEGGRVRVTPSIDGGSERVRVGAARAAVLLDPLRSGEPGNSLFIAVGPRYDVDVQGTPAVTHGSVVHRIAPFTDTSAGWRWQDRDGLTTFSWRGGWFPHWASRGSWRSDAFETSLGLDRVIVAVNDTPMHAMVDAGYSLYPQTDSSTTIEEGRVLVGLRVGWPLRGSRPGADHGRMKDIK
jgi:hypothetical protein